MLLEKYKQDYYYFSGEVSKLVNQFALAGIAVVWIFKSDKSGTPLIPHGLLTPLVCFVLSLGFALLHYFIASIIWGIFYRFYERKNKGNPNVDVKAKKILPNTIWFFYMAKVVALIAGFVFLSIFIFDKIEYPTKDVPINQSVNQCRK